MSQKIINHISQYLQKDGRPFDEENVYEALAYEAKWIWSGKRSSRRWWDDIFKVVELDGMLIGFWDGECTGDMSLDELGWEFDINTICDVKEKQIVSIVYEPIKDTDKN